jgi:outer membrane protein assembly factor BamE (lipoprotein component of BamABCDE complex)
MKTPATRWIRTLLAAVLVCMLAACDREGRPIEEFGLEKLARGVSTETEVRMAMGQPETVRDEPDGTRTLEYPKGPLGHRTWMFVIGRDGKLLDYGQVLNDDNFAKVRAGMSKDEVRRLLGKPRSIVPLRQKNEEVWDWLYMQSSTPRLFNVHFDMDSGKVKRTTSTDDPQHAG